jgi:Domain of unknown function (DUF4338)
MERHNQCIFDMNKNVPLLIKPALGKELAAFEEFCFLAAAVIEHEPESPSLGITFLRQSFRDQWQASPEGSIRLAAAQSVVIDLLAQGHELTFTDGGIFLTSPDHSGLTPEQVKTRVREAHLVNRAEQLSEPAVVEAITALERLRLAPKGWHSIFSVMRDGRELAEVLGEIATIEDTKVASERLHHAIRPYLQFVEPNVVCEHTGLRLQDIWRYFRHTWITEYKSLPGRNIHILVRDAAASHHPVIGIAALGSAVVQHTKRDEWIGWNADSLISRMSERPTKRWASWLLATLDRLLKTIFTQDLRDEGALSIIELRYPSDETVSRLRKCSLAAMQQHRRFPHAAVHKKASTNAGVGVTDWAAQAQTSLFRAKRCDALADLLEIKIAFHHSGLKRPDGKQLKAALERECFRKAVRRLAHRVKSETVGASIMDIIVCGSVAPYRDLLGGKLVSALMFSAEVVSSYRKRYENQESVIASAVKGAPVRKPANLVLLGTTSLYGVGSSQYNRIKIPLSAVTGDGANEGFLEYVNLGETKGYGSFHFSKDTIELLNLMLSREEHGRRVNSIFGEGVNPLMRKLRDGLNSLGFPSDELLQHGNRRIVYGVPLATNFTDVLLGMSRFPRYLVPQRNAKVSTQRIADYWLSRWVAGRILRPGVLENIAQHSLAHPVVHGARVELPAAISAQLELEI